MTSCASKKKNEKKIILPPKPQRQELPAPTNTKEIAEMLVYYEYLVEEWEAWSETVEEIIQ